MNSLLKVWPNRPRVGFVVLLLASASFAQNGPVFAAQKSKKIPLANSSFQLTLSNKVFKGDPQSKFLRHACEPGRHSKPQISKAKTSPKKSTTK